LLALLKLWIYSRGQQILSVKDQIVNISGSADHEVSFNYPPLTLQQENIFRQYVIEWA
jgi:hypothetical protein